MSETPKYHFGPIKDASIEAIDKAISIQREAIESLDPGHPDRAYLLNDEGVLWHAKYERNRNKEDIEQAVRAARDAVQALHPGTEDTRVVLGCLSLWLGHRFQELGHPEDLEEAISTAKRSLELQTSGSKQWWEIYNNVAAPFINRYGPCPYSTEALDKANNFHSAALNMARPGHEHSSEYFLALSRLCHARYRLSDSVQDLEKAIGFGYEAVKMSYFADGVDRGPVHLSEALFAHYQATHTLSSLEEGLRLSRIWLAKEGKSATPKFRAHALCNHGSMLEAKCHRVRAVYPAQALELLYEATQHGGEAVDLLGSEDKRKKAQMLNMIGAWYSTMMSISREGGIGDDAAVVLSHALTLASADDPERPRMLSNLMHLRDVQHQILAEQGQKLAAETALNEAITHAREVVDKTDDNDRYLGERLKNLGVLLLRKHNLTGEEERGPADQEARKYLALAATTERAPSLVRIPAAIQSGLYCWEYGELDEANQFLQNAISTLPSLTPQSVSTKDLQQTLSQVSGLGTFAAAIALEAGRPPFEALKSLEEARCIISGLSMSSRVDVSDLRDRDADLVAKYDNLRAQLELASKSLNLEGTYQHAKVHQQQLLQAVAGTEAEIRQQPGWESFKLPMTEDNIKELAVDGPVIVVNVTQIRCDAIVVTTKGINLVRLADMRYADLGKYAAMFGRLGNESRRNAVPRRKAETAVPTPEGALLWLWKVAVKPILDAIELTSSRRIWWLTTGLAGRIPFHAAGSHEVGSRDNTLSHVVSSYTSSFRALRFSRDKARRSETTTLKRSMLLVTMSMNPPPHRNLDTSHEERSARDAFGPAFEHLAHPDPETVLERLPKYPIVHFACHGASIGQDPSQSGLLLAQRGGGEPAMLSIASLEDVNIQDGAIAYLSACSTAEQTDGKLADEAIHLANSFQALGYRHVIGTMWGAEDAAAGEVARRFYGKLFPDDGRPGLDVAVALHEAMVDYMSEGSHGVVDWGPFVHVGV